MFPHHTPNVDWQYQFLLNLIDRYGDEQTTRNAITKSMIDAPPMTFRQTPLVTVRKTAWKKALSEMAWFMSGDTQCPMELMDWWDGQLGYGRMYRGGYSNQFRASGAHTIHKKPFDQIDYLLQGLRHSPYSRRLCLTTWNPEDMANITELNQNPHCPTCCHSSFVQLFVRDHTLHMTSYQRSADILLGLPHNLIQSWALLLYFARWGVWEHDEPLKVGSLRWLLGDAHIYQEESHVAATQAILRLDLQPHDESPCRLEYHPTVGWSRTPEFKVSDFVMEGAVPEPRCTIRPKLL